MATILCIVSIQIYEFNFHASNFLNACMHAKDMFNLCEALEKKQLRNDKYRRQ